MRVLMVEPGKFPYVTELKGDLKSMQKAVGGYIEGYYPFEDPVALICNEEGKIDGLPLNRAIYGENGQIVEAIAGNFFIAGLEADDFTDLPDAYMKKYSEMFKCPEEFVFLNGKLTAIPMPVQEQSVKVNLSPARKTVVVNLFAGPGAGKTTCAWEIASELKKRGIEAEYVSEYAKEFVWDGRTDILDGSLEHQEMLFTEQAHRINRLIGKVDVVVTDSPTLLGLLYLKEPNSDFEAQVLRDFNGHKNFNLFINRGQVFQQAGRIHNAAESKAIDKRVQDFLQAHQIYYGTYYHSTVGVLVNNIIKNLANVNQKSQKRSADCPAI